MGAGTASVLLNVLTLVNAGFQFQAIVAKVQDMQAKGADDKAVSTYLQNLRDAAMADLKADVAARAA